MNFLSSKKDISQGITRETLSGCHLWLYKQEQWRELLSVYSHQECSVRDFDYKSPSHPQLIFSTQLPDNLKIKESCLCTELLSDKAHRV